MAMWLFVGKAGSWRVKLVQGYWFRLELKTGRLEPTKRQGVQVWKGTRGMGPGANQTSVFTVTGPGVRSRQWYPASSREGPQWEWLEVVEKKRGQHGPLRHSGGS